MAAPSQHTKQVIQQRTPKKELVNTRQYLIKKTLLRTVMSGQGCLLMQQRKQT